MRLRFPTKLISRPQLHGSSCFIRCGRRTLGRPANKSDGIVQRAIVPISTYTKINTISKRDLKIRSEGEEDDKKSSEIAVEKPKQAGLDKRVYNIAVSSLLMGTGIGVIIPVMPLFATSIGISPAGLGLVVAVMGAARLTCNIPAAWAADRYGRKPLMYCGPFASAVGTFLCATAGSLPELLVYRVISGAGGSVQMTGSQLYLADISTPENRARTMAPLAVAFSIGMGLSPLVGGYIATNYGLAAPFLYVGTAMVLAGINNSMVLPETRPPSPDRPSKPLLQEVRSTIASWKPIASSPSMRSLLALHSVYWGVTSGAMFTLLPLFASEQFGVTAVELGQCFTALAVINLLGSQPAAYLSDRYGRKTVTVPALILMVATAVCLPLAGSKEQLAALWVVWGVGVTCLGTTPTAYATDINPEPVRGQALALLRSAGDIGLMLGAGSIGFIAKGFGIKAGFWTAAVLLAVVGANFTYNALESVGIWKKWDASKHVHVVQNTQTTDNKAETDNKTDADNKKP